MSEAWEDEHGDWYMQTRRGLYLMVNPREDWDSISYDRVVLVTDDGVASVGPGTVMTGPVV